jgi:hypothetical protein
MLRKLLPLVALLAVVGGGGLAQGPPAKEKEPFEKAVDKALVFLNNMQSSSGAWTMGGHGPNVAATSLAVMAFLSAGYVPGEGRYGKGIESGVRWVLTAQQPNGLIASVGGHHQMYHHGMATLMLAEVAGMTRGQLNKEVRKALEKAVAVILKAQRTTGMHRGGWRYTIDHGSGSDLSVSGWQILALRGAKNLGCDIPATTIDRALEYVKRCHMPPSLRDKGNGGFRYTPYNAVTLPCTGTGVLALELCGGKKEHLSKPVLDGVNRLIHSRSLDELDRVQGYFFYTIYYGAQATFQVGDSYWQAYRQRLHRVLLRHQRINGSWQGGTESQFGPNYCTALAVLALTVEYRYLPIYQRGKEPTDKK